MSRRSTVYHTSGPMGTPSEPQNKQIPLKWPHFHIWSFAYVRNAPECANPQNSNKQFQKEQSQTKHMWSRRIHRKLKKLNYRGQSYPAAPLELIFLLGKVWLKPFLAYQPNQPTRLSLQRMEISKFIFTISFAGSQEMWLAKRLWALRGELVANHIRREEIWGTCQIGKF